MKPQNITPSKSLRKAIAAICAITLFGVLTACGDSGAIKKLTSSSAAVSATADRDAALGRPGAKIQFDHASFYSITSPHPLTGCAGDARTYLDYSASIAGTPSPFSADPLVSNSTYKPGFIKNVSVDITDSNSNVSANGAYSCSYGANTTVASASSCATFDYGAIGGVPTSLGGSLFMIGGIQVLNYQGYAPSDNSGKGLSVACGPMDAAAADITSCAGGVYALGIETLPASAAGSDLAPGASTSTTAAISSWYNLNPDASATVPTGAAGSSIAYDPGTRQIALFAGASPFSVTSPNGSDTVDTWTYDVGKEKWTKLNPIPYASSAITTLSDTGLAGTAAVKNFTKTITARALFGYTAVPNLSLTQMDSGSTNVTSTNIDATERIVIVGGLNGSGISKDSYKFNPTFGPEWTDANAWSNSANTNTTNSPTAPSAGNVVQWLDSYHTQLFDNSQTTSLLSPQYNGATALQGFNFGLVPILDTSAASNVGYFMSLGGFDFATGINAATAAKGRMLYSKRTDGTPLVKGNFLGQPNQLGNFGNMTPINWTEVAEGAAPDVVPWFGGVSAVQGFNKANNEIAYFGGSACRDFMTDGTLTAGGCAVNTLAKYYTLSAGAGTFNAGTKALTGTATAFSAGAPQRAGMATARGLDKNGFPIIVTWGGMGIPNTTAGASSDDNIYVAYNAAGTPTWRAGIVPAGTLPPRLTNAAMVFSHVTGKFYLNGGYQVGAITQTIGDTYELSLSSCTAGAANAGLCTYTWKRLDSNGLTCYPNCPQARRSHRMVEVNYNNTNPTADVTPATCTAAAPCSFGIFMEGGTPDGFALYSDRWMFDPTANGGIGHWQRVDGFPPRHLAAMTTVDYTMPDGSGTAHRAIMFGGETGLHTPEQALSSTTSVYLPPTLGDTFMYDFDNNSWQRTQLLGKGYKTTTPTLNNGFTEFDIRQAYDATDTAATNILANSNWNELSAFSPPATSGAIMVTRTMSGSSLSSPTPLIIPEVFLIGGRLKNGKYSAFDNVYKFCAGTTGEKPYIAGLTDNASCDAFDPTDNPNSPNPSRSYYGRWLKKNAISLDGVAGAATKVGSFMGAGAYDSVNDRILVYGGMTSSLVGVGADHVTSVTRTASTNVYEYTPPSKAKATLSNDLRNGRWDTIPVCNGSLTPNARYGHTMAYDSLNRQIIIVGGYDIANGTQLTQTQTDAIGTTLTIPEVWTAKKVTSLANLPNGVPNTVSAPFPCYYWEQKVTFGNSFSIASQLPPKTGLSHLAGVFIPTTGYNSGFYTMQDQYCTNAGPIVSNDPATSKLYAGGAYIDIDRSALGPHENVLLHLTYIPMGTNNQRPDGQAFNTGEVAVLKIHLISSGMPQTAIESTFQPRYLRFSDSDQFAHVVEQFQVLAPATGAVRQDQLLIPLNIDSSIDRIRIERVSGTSILIDATVTRTGYR